MKHPRALVATVGGTTQPIIIAITRLKPESIYFIASVDTQSYIPEILEKAFPEGNEAEEHTFIIENHNSVYNCYLKCYEAFEEIRERGIPFEEVTADPTGGTKIMSAGLLLAVLESNVTITYVGGKERTKHGVGVVLNGHEEVYESPHPYHIIARFEKERFCQFFNSYRYQSAADVCAYIIERGGEKGKKLFGILQKICEGYRDWDRFKLKTGYNIIKQHHSQLLKYMENDEIASEKLERFVKEVEENLAHFENILRVSDYGKIYCWEMVEELAGNALRRAEEDKYDDAVARLYRTQEMIAQVRIWERFEYTTDRFPYDKLTVGLKESFRERMNDKGFVKIAQAKAWELLSEVNDEYGKIYMEHRNDLRALLNLRNESILAHGKTPLDTGKFMTLYDTFKRLFKIDGTSLKLAKIELDELLPVGVEIELHE